MSPERPVVAYMFADMNEGEVFDAWPVHMTLIPSARCDVGVVQDAVGQVMRNMTPIPMTIGQPDLFSPNRDVPVFHVEPADELRQIHQTLLRRLGGPSMIHNANDEWLDDDYVPHVTPKPGQQSIQPGEEHLLDRLMVIGKEGGRRIVRGIVRLGE